MCQYDCNTRNKCIAANVQFKAAKGTAVIDCVKDDAYLATDEIAVAFGATADTASGKVWSVWDDKALYFYAEIADKTLSSAPHADNTVWQRDSCEFYVDFTNEQEDTDITTINATQYTTGFPYRNGEFWSGMDGHWAAYSDQCTYKTKAAAEAAPTETTPAAQTSDIAGIAVLVSIITLAGIAISKKKQ